MTLIPQSLQWVPFNTFHSGASRRPTHSWTYRSKTASGWPIPLLSCDEYSQILRYVCTCAKGPEFVARIE